MAAADNFGWFGSVPIYFRRWHIPFSAGGGGWSQRLTGLISIKKK